MSKRSNKKKQAALRQKKLLRAEQKHALESMAMVEAIEKIVEMADDSKLTEKFFQQAEPYAKIIAEKQEITIKQAVLLSLFVEYETSSRKASINDIARFVDCRNIRLLKYKPDVEELVKGHFLRRTCRFDETHYYVPTNVIKALVENKKYERESYQCDDTTEFLKKFYSFTHLNHEDDLAYDLFYEEIKLLFHDNQELDFVKKIKSLKLEFIDEVILTHFCRHLALHDTEAIPEDSITFLIEDTFKSKELSRSLKNGKYVLMKKKLIEYNYDDGFEDKDWFRLTDKARKTLLKGFNLKMSKQGVRDFILSKSIEEKKLFYEGETISQIGELEGLLNEENFKSIKERMKAQKMRCGFACIFYGSPGTGKTETALQLARMTGRDIMQVNISAVKSCWVGESEKNIKAIFDRYREQSKKAKLAPILLFNEADAVIGKRKEGAERAVDKMENSIQNIILQEMETLDGIMIATTNLEQNMDKAFERRFLYKVKFNKPSASARANIWRSMIPTLSNNESLALAEKYDFSGGQIENIARHYAIDNVLHGDGENRLERLFNYSDSERFEKKEQRKIGFV
jgi:hypothetical protein